MSSSSSPRIQPISDITKELVRSAAQNGGRCLVENIEAGCAVDFYHCFSARMGRNTDLLNRIEWHWNMERGSLDLDTRWNIFCAGATVHALRSHRQWVLLPEDDIIRQYFSSLTPAGATYHAERDSFPEIPNGSDFGYRLIPLQGMHTVALTHQDVIPKPGTLPKREDFTIHVYPFDNLHLTSHVHPKFAILEAGRIFERLSNSLPSDSLATLSELYPTLPLTISLFQAWTDSLPIDAMSDQTYNASGPPENESADDSDEDGVLEESTSKRTSYQRYREARRNPTAHSRDFDIGKKTWNADAIRSWAGTGRR